MTLDFQTNKKLCDEVALIPSKNLRNKIAGYVTHLTKRMSKKSIRKLPLNLEEKEKNSLNETKLSEFIKNVQMIDVDEETYKMLEKTMNGFSSFSIKFKINILNN